MFEAVWQIKAWLQVCSHELHCLFPQQLIHDSPITRPKAAEKLRILQIAIMHSAARQAELAKLHPFLPMEMNAYL